MIKGMVEVGAEPRVLLVGGKIEVRESIEEFLTVMLIPYLVANNPSQAVEILKTNSIDILITSFKFPKMDGLTLLEWCRKSNLHFPVIFISDRFHSLSEEQEALRDCCVSILERQADLQIFQKTFFESLNSRRADDFKCRSSELSLQKNH